MNKLHSKFASVVILAILLFSLNSMEATKVKLGNAVPRGQERENFCQFEIYAGQNNLFVGYVEMWSDLQFTYVRYSTIPGWYLMETNLHLAMNLRDIPQTEMGEPRPERFTYQARHNLVNQYTFQIPRVAWRYGAAYSIVTNRTSVPRAIGWAHNIQLARNFLPRPWATWFFEKELTR
jgi:hypothetical protein